MSRTLERSIARNLYAKFSKRWRDEKKLADVYGKPGYRRPSFSEWYSIHQKNIGMMKESAPADVVEYLGDDPWAGAPSYKTTAQTYPGNEPQNNLGERGVATIDFGGNEDE